MSEIQWAKDDAVWNHYLSKLNCNEVVDIDIEVLKEQLLFLRDANERNFNILVKRYGLLGDDPLTLQCLADEYGLSRERIRQIYKELNWQLNKPLAAELRRKWKSC